ncbi:MAG: hypothetical protein RLZ10_746 [Bacteroidota bacterium]|jgi:hypothetical protein
MSYEINVSKNGRHVFATHEKSINTLGEAAFIVSRLEKAFPQSEGYFITISKKVVSYVPVPDKDLVM